jgi:hypothetical protein
MMDESLPEELNLAFERHAKTQESISSARRSTRLFNSCHNASGVRGHSQLAKRRRGFWLIDRGATIASFATQ